MQLINKAPEKLTSKERVRRSFALANVDRIPMDYCSNAAVHQRLCNALSIRDRSDCDELFEALGVDYRGIGVPYVGKPLFPEIEGMQVDPQYGFYSRYIENAYGGYNDFCYFPLQDAEPDVIVNYPTPNPDDYDYSVVANAVKRYKGKAIYVGNAGVCDIINSLGRVMGMEDTLVNLQLGDEATLTFMHNKVTFEREVLARTLEAIVKAGGSPDFLWIGEDLGTQIAPMIGMDLFKRIFIPEMRRFVELANSYNIPTMIHTCGSSSWAYESFIAMGIRAVDTLQPEAVNMAPEYLKSHFGGRLSFHGCISTARLADYTADEVTEDCRQTIETLMPCGGYQFAPTHMIQDNTPVENIIAMYNAAHRFGCRAQ